MVGWVSVLSYILAIPVVQAGIAISYTLLPLALVYGLVRGGGGDGGGDDID